MINKIKSGLSWSTVSVLFKAILLFIQMILLARLLSPNELGQIAVLNVIIGLVYLLTDLGLTSAIIYNKNIPTKTLKQLQSLNVYFGLFLSVVLILVSRTLSNFYESEEIELLIILIAPAFFIKSIGLQSYALSQRALQFGLIAKIDIFSTILGFLGLVVSLAVGGGVYSVVVMQIITSLLFSYFSIYYSPFKFEMQLNVKYSEVKVPLKYAMYQSADNIFNYISSQADNIIIGKVLGMEVLGIYSYMKELLIKPSIQVVNLIFNRMLFPVMSSLDSLANKGDVYLQSNKALSVINSTMYVMLYLYGDEFITLVYGGAWLDYVEIYNSMIPYVLLISLINPVGSLMKATGYVKLSFHWNFFTSVLRVLIVIFTASYGVVFLVHSLTIFMFSLFLLQYYFLLVPVANISFKDMYNSYLPSFLFGVLSLLVYLLVEYFYGSSNVYINSPIIFVMISLFVVKEIKLIGSKR